MAGLQRFITYIYKYENDQKKDNAGFAKIEIRGGVCRMEVHIRNTGFQKQECTVYLFTENADLMQGIPVGSVMVSRGNGDVRYTFDIKELAEFGVAMKDMEGIFIPIEDGNYFASQWKEGTIAYNRFRILEKRTPDSAQRTEPTENQSQVQPQQNQSQNKDLPKEQSQTQSREQEIHPQEQTSIQEQVQTQEQTQPIHATELPLDVFFEEVGWEKIFQKFRLKCNLFFPFEGREIECARIQLKDLQEFPKKYWYFGRNSFLLHGFFNYKHIIFGEMRENGKKEYILGVPGVFMNQERIMAAMFGFPEFCTAKAAEYKTGNFGYWYRII